jgi:membrane-associated phospholipid phosphatase
MCRTQFRRGRSVVSLLFFFALFASGPARAQDAPPANPLPASSPLSNSSANINRNISWRRLAPNILHDQKEVWLFPTKVAHGHHLIPVCVITSVTSGLLAGDPYDAPYFRRTSTYSGFNRAFSGAHTNMGTLIAPLAFYGVGLIRKSAYEQDTALLAGEAILDTFLVSSAMKVSTLRLRPSDISPSGNFTDTFFEQGNITGGSFPSGHTIAAFSVATVFARRYPQHRWVAWLSYSAAAAVGFSRLTLQAHFPSDVFLGAALGYATSRFAVLAR